MNKFIEVHSGRAGTPMLVNLGLVESIQPNNDGTCHIWMRTMGVNALESYEAVRLLVGAAQGGIPMPTHLEGIRGMD